MLISNFQKSCVVEMTVALEFIIFSADIIEFLRDDCDDVVYIFVCGRMRSSISFDGLGLLFAFLWL